MSHLDPAGVAAPVRSDRQSTAQGGMPVGHRPPHARWKTLLKSSVRRRVPVVLQMSAVECGAACLAMILSYYGRQTGVSEVREHCGVGRDGLSASGLVRAARAYGMRTRAISVESQDLRFIALPAIIHWDFNHFLVVERWKPGVVEAVDPRMGRIRLSAKEFEQSRGCYAQLIREQLENGEIQDR